MLVTCPHVIADVEPGIDLYLDLADTYERNVLEIDSDNNVEYALGKWSVERGIEVRSSDRWNRPIVVRVRTTVYLLVDVVHS